MPKPTLLTCVLSVISASALAAIGMATGVTRADAAQAPIQPQPANSITADALPTVQINGVVWSTDVAGNKVYAGGSFTKARPAGAAVGTNETTRNNLLAFDINTGVMDTSFAPDLNGQVLGVAVTPDKSRVYVVGDFTTANGQARRRVAAYSTATGALITSFNPVGVNARARSVAATNDTVYVGGSYGSAGSSSRGSLAAFRASDGALLPWAPVAERPVWGLAVTQDGSSVYAAGQFTTINGQDAYGLAKINGTTGVLDTAWHPEVRNAGDDAAVGSIKIQNNSLYGTSWHYGAGGNLEGTFKISLASATGSADWVTDCHGDNYSSFMSQGTVYVASHAHYCGNMGGGHPQYPAWKFQHAQAWSDTVTGDILNDVWGYNNWHPSGMQGPAMVNWLPDMAMGSYTGQYQAGWTVTGNDDVIVYGGEFPRVNGSGQQGLVRYGKRPVAPGAQKPMFASGSFIPQITARTTTSARVTWSSAYDRDDRTLTYKLYRNNVLINTQNADSNWWTTPALGYVDTTVVPGTTYSYRMTVSDPGGNVVNSNTVSYAAPASVTAANSYAQAVTNAGANLYWPLNDTRTGSPMTIRDWAGFNDGVADNDVNAGQDGAIPGNAGMTFGTAEPNQPWGRIYSNGNLSAPDTFTTQVWIKTSSTTGGRIFGFSDVPTGDSGHHDRHIYMSNDGKLLFGVRAQDGSNRTIGSGKSYNDDKWHMVTATMSPAGMALYVDGVRVARRTDTTQGETYLGYWRVQGDTLGGWANQPASNNFVGSIDEVAVYPTALDQTTILAQYTASGRTSVVPQAPADNYGAAVYNDDPDLYWRFNESTGTTAADSGRSLNDGAYRSGVTLGADGVLAGNKAALFDGADDAVYSNAQFSNPTVYSEEAWFKTNSTSGGKIIGFGNAQNGESNNYDRHVYMLANGHVVFGVWTGQTNTVETPVSFNDNEWHHVVATQGPDGMKLYLDGELQGTNPQTQSQAYDGYWRVGGDSTWGGDNYFDGVIDEAAVYSYVLDSGRVLAHFQAAGGHVNEAPTATFTSTQDQRRVTFSGSGTDSDGSIAGYQWDFGDGTTSTEQNPTHVYTTDGAFTVKLTVFDNKGASGNVSHAVTVSAPAQADTYGASVSADNPRIYWRLDETDGNVVHDVSGGLTTGTINNGSTKGITGAIDNPNTAMRFNIEGGDQFIASDDVFNGPSVYTEEAWFKTTSTSGGKIVGFGCNNTGTSGCYDRHVFLVPDGRVVFGAWTGQENTVYSPTPYNDGQWHHMVASQSSNGMKLYLDGQLVGTNPQTAAQDYTGYWRVGGDNAWDGSDAWFDGDIDEVAIYNYELGAGRVAAHYAAAQPAPNQHPIAALSVTKSNLDVTADATGSSDPDGNVDHYLFDFGDGTPVVNTTNPVAQHTYVPGDGLAHSYTVKVTVVDNEGAGTDKSQSVTVQAANVDPVSSFTATVDHLDVGVNGSASIDPDGGTIVSYKWNWGDGQANTTTTGPTADHTYATAGHYTITLTVTDNRGGTNSSTQDVETTMPPNQHPNAAFTSEVTKLKVTFNSSGSNDPDGSIASRTWDFGDGSTSTDTNPSHTYAAANTYTVKLTVTDNGGATDTVQHDVTTIANVAPTASFSVSKSDLTATFTSTASDSDGTVAGYSWDFGDGGSSTAVNPSRTYAAAGTYTVKLTVTDDDGATKVVTDDVTVTAPTQIAADDFNRTVNNGWGTADTGGAWTVSTASSFAVASGNANLTTAAGNTRTAFLNGVSARDVDITTSLSYDKAATGGGVYSGVVARRIGTSDYRVVVATTSTKVQVQLRRTVSGTETTLTTATLAGGTLAANSVLNIRFQVSGTNGTTLQAKVWRAGDAEPTAWTTSTTDPTAALQAAGGVGVYGYLSSSATAVPVTAKFPQFLVVPV